MTAPRPAAARSDRPANVVRQSRGGKSGGSRRGFYAVLLLIAVVGIGALLKVTSGGGARAAAIVVPPAPPGTAAPIGYHLGNPNAPVEIVEYADFECSVCGQYFAVTEPDVRKQLIEPGIARYTIYDIQINKEHGNSPAASLAAACANEQGQFWPMHDRLYGTQDAWNSFATTSPRPIFADYAKQLGLDMTKWNACYDAQRYTRNLAINRAEFERIGAQGTPAFVIGGKLMKANPTFDAIKAMVDSAKSGGATPPVAAR